MIRKRAKPRNTHKVGTAGKGKRFRTNKPPKEKAVELPVSKQLSELAIERFKRRSRSVTRPAVVKIETPSPKKQVSKGIRKARNKQVTKLMHRYREFKVPLSVPEHLLDWYITKRNFSDDFAIPVI